MTNPLLLAAAMAGAGLVLGAYELALTRLASVLFFHDLAYLCLAIALLALGVGGLLVRRRAPDFSALLRLVGGLVLTIPAAWWALTSADTAWGLGVFAVPFGLFGAASAMAFRLAASARLRARIYAAEVAGAVLGLVVAGPAVLTVLDMPALDGPGVQTHLRATAAREGVRSHRAVTTSYARTDLLRTDRDDVAYAFTDGMFVARSVAWDGRRPTFASAAIERLARLKRLPYALAPRGDVLLLGAGAGFDIAVALQAGVARVVAVEVNPEVVAFARRRDALAGRLFARPMVRMLVA